MFTQNDEKVSIIDRIKRLISKVIEAFKSTFTRGAGFGAIDAVVGVLTQIFKSVSSKIKTVWKSLRTSTKSIYNAIYSYTKGEIKTYQDLARAIIKALFSFTTIIGSLGLEAKIEAALLPIMPGIASFISPILAIIAGAFAVVVGTRMIDSGLNYLFGLHASLLKSRAHRAEIEAIIDEFLPQLVEDNEKLRNLIDSKFKNLKMSLDSSFADLQNAISSTDSNLFISSLVGINSAYGMKLKYLNFGEFDIAMKSDKPIVI